MSAVTATPPIAATFAPTVPTPLPHEDPFGGMAGLRRFTVDEYHSMIRAGVLAEGEPVELLEGYVVTKMACGPKHDHAIRVLTHRLVRMLPDGWAVSPQTAATLSDSEPEPDFTIARGRFDSFSEYHPRPADIALLIEIADSSVRRDTRDKSRIYARAGIPVYWVVNIPEKRLEVYSQPSGPADQPAFKEPELFPVGSVVPVVLDGTQIGTIAVAEVIA